jgi:sec-independent protein translocase protein TatB
MFNVGGGELLVILLIALLVLGPDRLPGFAKKAGKVMGDIRRISNGFQAEIRQAMDFDDDRPAPTANPATSAPRLVEPPPPVPPPTTEAAARPDDTSPMTPPAGEQGGDTTSGSSAA